MQLVLFFFSDFIAFILTLIIICLCYLINIFLFKPHVCVCFFLMTHAERKLNLLNFFYINLRQKLRQSSLLYRNVLRSIYNLPVYFYVINLHRNFNFRVAWRSLCLNQYNQTILGGFKLIYRLNLILLEKSICLDLVWPQLFIFPEINL